MTKIKKGLIDWNVQQLIKCTVIFQKMESENSFYP